MPIHLRMHLNIDVSEEAHVQKKQAPLPVHSDSFQGVFYLGLGIAFSVIIGTPGT